MRAQAGVSEVWEDEEGGGNERLLRYFFASVFHTLCSTDWQNMVPRERHAASNDHSFSGSPAWRSNFHTFPSFRKHGSKEEGNEMEKVERGLTY